jgi:Pentapeptide repeats (8 copies)
MTSLISIAILVAIVVLWKVPRLQVRSYHRRYPDLSSGDLLQGENDARATLAQVLGGALLLGGLYYTAETLALQQEGQLTDRISKAVEQLGSEKSDISLGGIYQLARIARDSDRDHWPMMQILMSYVERRAPLPAMGSTEIKSKCDPFDPYDSSGTPDYNLQAALEAIRTRDTAKENRAERVSIVHTDLRYTDLSQADLTSARLVGNDMGYAHLVASVLDGSDLNHSLLNYSDLSNARLSNAHLEGACLVRANLKGANLRGSNLTNADLRGISFADGADFSAAVLKGVDITGADLSKATGLSRQQFIKVTLDCNTILPPDLATLQTGLKCDE